MQPQYHKPRSYGPPVKMAIPPAQHSDNDRSSGELRALDCNLTSLCDHIQLEGFTSGSFSDIVVHAMGSTYRLHRLILSRSSYFRNMLHGPWKEANASIVTLHVDDSNVNGEAIEMALAYLYGHHPKLNDNNAFRVLAAASFLDLQDLCAICTDFIISELWTSNFLAYQVFAESQDYGIHGERVRNACWGYLCQSGAMELKEVLPKLSSQTLHALLTSDELWVPSEEKRFELALYTLLAKDAFCKAEHPEQESSTSEMGMGTHSNSSKVKGKNLTDNGTSKILESELGHMNLKDELEGHNAAHNILVELLTVCMEQTASFSNTFSDGIRSSCSYVEMPIAVGTDGLGANEVAMEGPSEEGSCYLNNNNWLSGDQSAHCSSMNSSCNGPMPSEWGRCGLPPSCGDRVVGRRQVKGHDKGNSGLEELGFPCKAVNDGLWLQIEGIRGLVGLEVELQSCMSIQVAAYKTPVDLVQSRRSPLWDLLEWMLLSQRVQEIGADTCKNCFQMSMACACRQPFGISHGNLLRGRQIATLGLLECMLEELLMGLLVLDVELHFVSAAAWPPTRFVFSRVPYSMGNRNCQQSLVNDDLEARADHNGDLSGDGLTALVGLSQGGSNIPNVHVEQTERGYETDLQSRSSGASITAPSTSGIPLQMLDSQENAIGIEWENANNSSIPLDMKTPLSHFPPFRFGVEFEDVHRLSDGQVKHSPEVFYAGSLWKVFEYHLFILVSVQAFSDEDPQGRRTLGLFLHRRKAEITDSIRKVHMYVDSREKVTARYQLICPSKRDVMVFGRFKQTGIPLPKAPKGWGWRTALLFDELADLLQNGALRVAAVVQLI
ncbi:Germ cell-less protein-like 1 [Vitis vinifera]|uniref:Germ cell-less protein-like 1 n=1 Tax=Vitis vinifera TaxID=29760 RepID=A0A438KLT4_VITVI|nr:Germ cell-less protein-like 1 [Vitis vinifera]